MNLGDFVRESNRIEGILRDPTAEEISAHYQFCELEKPTVQDVANFVRIVQPDARLRDNISVPGVRVGGHIAPPSGPEIREQLEHLLDQAHHYWKCQMNPHWARDLRINPWLLHCDYETLHPFTDGNGRSGRVFWLWMHGGRAPLGFLHQFYYETLQNRR